MRTAHEPDQCRVAGEDQAEEQIRDRRAADLVPAEQGRCRSRSRSRRSSRAGRERSLKPLSYQAGSQRLILQTDFFGGRSLGRLLLQPLQMLAFPLALWAASCAGGQARRAGASRAAWDDMKTSWAEDVLRVRRRACAEA